MKYLLLFLLSSISYAQVKVVELDKMSMEYRYHRNYRDAFFPQYETIEGHCTVSSECFRYGANVQFDLNLVRVKEYKLFWRNDVMMDATNKQVRHVGWFWEAGTVLYHNSLSNIEAFIRHESRHILDDEPQTVQRYPIRDEYVLKINFYQRR